MSILLIVHSYLRWLILIAALVTIVKFFLGWRRGGAFENIDHRLASGFSSLMDLQATLGLVYLIWDGVAKTGFPTYRIEHAITMIIAAGAAHLHVLWKNSENKIRFRNSLFVILDVLIIVFIGVARLPGGWGR